MKPFDLPRREAPAANEEAMPRHEAAGAANDLRNYLQRSVVLRSRALAEASRRSEPISLGRGRRKTASTFKSLDDVIAHLRLDAGAEGPSAVLVMAARQGVDASDEAVRIARDQAAEHGLTVLVDLTRGLTATCAKLSIPCAPGLAELAAGHAAFDDIVHVDHATSLQAIAAGTHIAKVETKQRYERLARIFEALAQVYHFIVLHADRETALNYQQLLAGRLRTVVVVLAPGEGRKSELILAELAGFGCTVLFHEQSAERRWFLRRSA
jgi:Mrp family chromosome partitioning ATPase